MKKNSFYLLAIMMAAVLCVGFTSCGDDDDEENPQNSEKDLVGWYRNCDDLGECWGENTVHPGDPIGEDSTVISRVIHIIDDTFLDYYAKPKVEYENKKGAEAIYKIDADGEILTFYQTPVRLAYDHPTNKSISFVIPGDDKVFLTPTSEGFRVADGYGQDSQLRSQLWLKYDPNKAYKYKDD